MKIENLNDLFVHTLQDIYFAENQIVKALPKMADKADSKTLKTAFESHLAETKEQIKRLEKVFEIVGEKAKGEECPAIEGIIEEADELMSVDQGCRHSRRRHDRRGSGRRALRDHALRHARFMGEAPEAERGRQGSRRHAQGRVCRRRQAHRSWPSRSSTRKPPSSRGHTTSHRRRNCSPPVFSRSEEKNSCLS